MANPFLIEDATSTFVDSNNTFNPFLTSTTADLESHNDNPFFSTFSSSNSVQDNTNPFLTFAQNSEPAQPVVDLLGINEKSHSTIIEDVLKVKPPPPRPVPPKRPPPRPTPPLNDAKELILSVTGEMDATSLHMLDRLSKTPSPIPMRDLLSPSPTPTADLLGCDDLQPPITCQSSSVFDQQPNVIDLPSGPKPERPKFPPKIDFLMDDLLEDVPIDEGIQPVDNFVQNRAPSIPENPPIIGGSKPPSRKSSDEFIPSIRRLSHDVTESRKIMPDLSKIADRRKSDIGHFAPIIPIRKPSNQNEELLPETLPESPPEITQEILPAKTIQEVDESEKGPNINNFSNIPESLLPTEEIQEEKMKGKINTPSPIEINCTWEEEKNGLDFDSQQQIESSNKFESGTVTNDSKLTSPAEKLLPFESTENDNVFDNGSTRPFTELSLPSTEEIVREKSDVYDEKSIPPAPDPSPFQEISSQETVFNAAFEASETISSTPFDIQDPKQLETINSTENTVYNSFPEKTDIENDAFDAFAAKFDDSQNESNVSGGAFDAFGGVSTGFDNSAMGFGADDNFDSFLSIHQIPAAPQSTPSKVTRNNSGESLDENDFNVFIR